MSVLRWDAVPGLGLAVVHEVDGVEVHVLDVPTEGGLPHPEVQVRGQHALKIEIIIV